MSPLTVARRRAARKSRVRSNRQARRLALAARGTARILTLTGMIGR